MLGKIGENFAIVIRDKDIQHYAGDGILDLIKSVCFSDTVSGVDGIINIKNLLFHLPTALFWGKMQRFLLGTYKNYEEQIKMASKFDKDDKNYYDLVKKQMQIIDQIDEDLKIDYFANLTRAYLLENMIDMKTYYKVANILKSCTVDELQYLTRNIGKEITNNNIFISSLMQEGLVHQKLISGEEEVAYHGNNNFEFTGLAEVVDKYGVAFGDGKYAYDADMIVYEEIPVLTTKAGIQVAKFG